jgi:putative ABC transport system permease protein
MLRNYLTSAFRSVLKHQFFSLIHIGGLAIGLTASIFVIHFARMEYSLDDFHADSERIYRVATARLRDGVEATRFATTFAGAGPAIQADNAGVESFTRLFFRSRGGIVTWTQGNQRFREHGLFNVDSGFFKVFSFPILAGRAEDLYAPRTAFVEEATARKYFGDTNPIGQHITFGTVEGVEEYEIRGVVRCPENSSLTFTFLLSYHGLSHFFGSEHYTNWLWLDFHTFIKLHPGADPGQLESHLPALLKKFRGDRASNSKLILQKLPDIYLQSAMEFETGRTGDESIVRILMVLGIILLAIVGLNFINLSTSMSFTRVKEVGIRKTLGSHRQNLVFQFMAETSITNLVAAFLCVFLLWLFLPSFNMLTGRNLEFAAFLRQDLWIYLSLFFIGGTLLLGLWPALQLSSFRPIDVLKGLSGRVSGGAWLRKGFVGFQAFVSFSLVVVILVILDQVNYVQNKDLGIQTANTLVIRTPAVVTGRDPYYSSLDAFITELQRDAQVTHIATSADCPGKDVAWVSGTRKLGAPLNEGSSMYRADVDEMFVPLLNLTLLAGRNFEKTSPSRDALVNETALRQLGFATPEEGIGQPFLCGYDTLIIVGVVKDYHQVSPREAMSPTIFHNRRETPSWFFIRYEGDDAMGIVRRAETVFGKVFPTDFFDYFFLDEFYDRQYQLERRLATIMLVFCSLAVTVSSLGLLGLTWFTVSRRRKELAIRKVVGSSEARLYRHATGGIFITTLAGSMVGIPITTYIMTNWLETFAMHTTVKPWVFGVALIVSLLVAVATVSGYTLKVIRSNPVVHLRSE